MPTCERVGPDFVDKATVRTTVEVNVSASPAQVWQVLNETERWPEWFDGMKTARVTSAEWNGIGSSRYVKVGPLGVDEEIVAWEPEKLWGFCATQLNLTGWIAKRMVEVVEIHPDGSGSRLVYTGALDPVPWLKPMGGLLKNKMASSWAENLPHIDRQISA